MRPPRIVGICLAAGASRRMGRPKLALPWGGVPLGSRALEAALRSPLERVVVVVREGDPLEWIPAPLHAPPLAERWQPVVCAGAASEQAASLRRGIEAAAALGADAALVLLADQPGVTAAMLGRLLAAFAGERRLPGGMPPADAAAGRDRAEPHPAKPCRAEPQFAGRSPAVPADAAEAPAVGAVLPDFAAASFGGLARPPVVFSAAVFPLLCRLQGDQGARRLLREPGLRGITVAFADESLFIDIDTPEEYLAFRPQKAFP